MWDNKLTLNTLKTEFILISSIPKHSKIGETCCIHIQDENIYRSPYTKSLGFYIDQHLGLGEPYQPRNSESICLRFLWRGSINKT